MNLMDEKLMRPVQQILYVRKKIFTNNKSQELIIIFLILALSVSVRVWDIGENGFNSDEAVYSGQAANLAGFEEFNKHFSLFRAHPLLLQFFISVAFTLFGVNDVIARLIPIIFGTLTILVTYLLARNLFDKNTAIVSSLILSVLPYHITMSKQVFVDIPLSFFYLLTLFCVVKFNQTNTSTLYPITIFSASNKTSDGDRWIYATGISAGLCFISKEIGVFSLISIFVYMIILKRLTIKFSFIIISLFIVISIPFLFTPLVIEDAKKALLEYYEWQRSRESSTSNTFYLQILLNHGLGYILSGLIIISIIYLIIIYEKKTPYMLLLIWIIIPLTFYHLLPLKGYNYLVSVIPPLVIMGSSILIVVKKKYRLVISVIVILCIPISLEITKDFPIDDKEDLPTAGPTPYVRDAAMWIKENSDNESKILTIHSSTANILKFYSNRDAIPLKANQNPAYTSLDDADLAILNNKIDYLIYEPYISEKFPTLDQTKHKMKGYITKHNLKLVFSSNQWNKSNEPYISIYEAKN